MGCALSRAVRSTANADMRIFDVSNVDDQGRERQPGKLEVTDNELILHHVDVRGSSAATREAVHWPLRSLRRYGFDAELFSFECGRRCPTGPGIYAFRCRRAETLFNLLQECIIRAGQDLPETTTLSPASAQQSNRLSVQFESALRTGVSSNSAASWSARAVNGAAENVGCESARYERAEVDRLQARGRTTTNGAVVNLFDVTRRQGIAECDVVDDGGLHALYLVPQNATPASSWTTETASMLQNTSTDIKCDGHTGWLSLSSVNWQQKETLDFDDMQQASHPYVNSAMLPRNLNSVDVTVDNHYVNAQLIAAAGGKRPMTNSVLLGSDICASVGGTGVGQMTANSGTTERLPPLSRSETSTIGSTSSDDDERRARRRSDDGIVHYADLDVRIIAAASSEEFDEEVFPPTTSATTPAPLTTSPVAANTTTISSTATVPSTHESARSSAYRAPVSSAAEVSQRRSATSTSRSTTQVHLTAVSSMDCPLTVSYSAAPTSRPLSAGSSDRTSRSRHLDAVSSRVSTRPSSAQSQSTSKMLYSASTISSSKSMSDVPPPTARRPPVTISLIPPPTAPRPPETINASQQWYAKPPTSANKYQKNITSANGSSTKKYSIEPARSLATMYVNVNGGGGTTYEGVDSSAPGATASKRTTLPIFRPSSLSRGRAAAAASLAGDATLHSYANLDSYLGFTTPRTSSSSGQHHLDAFRGGAIPKTTHFAAGQHQNHQNHHYRNANGSSVFEDAEPKITYIQLDLQTPSNEGGTVGNGHVLSAPDSPLLRPCIRGANASSDAYASIDFQRTQALSAKAVGTDVDEGLRKTRHNSNIEMIT